MLRAELFGDGRFWLDQKLLALPSKQSRSLLAYLLVHPQPHSRDHLAGLFWADLSDDQARKRLSQVLWQVRKELGDKAHWIEADQERVGWSEGALKESDHGQFKEALLSKEPTEWEAGLEFYKGELLPGLYDDWVLEERDHCQEQALGVLRRLMRSWQSQGEPERALQAGRRLTSLEPLDEEAQRDLLRLYLLLGRKREALEQYRRAVKALDELGEQPGAELEALRRLAEESGERQESPLEMSGSIQLVGRSSERQVLLENLQRRKSGVALVEGEAGMGKSRLIQEVVQEARWQGFTVLQAKAHPGSSSVPYGLLREALAGVSGLQLEALKLQLEPLWLGVLGQLVPALGGMAKGSLKPEEETRRMQQALVLGLQALSRSLPVLLLLDDLHWADESTLEALPVLAQLLSGSPVWLLLGYRSSEARERVAIWNTLQALSPQVVARVELKPLTQTETAELVRRSLGLGWPVPRFETRVFAETQGNPLFVLETLRSLYEEGLLHRDAQGVWSTPIDEQTQDYRELPLAPTVRQVIVERLNRLSEPSRKLVGALAVLDAAELEVLAQVAGNSKVEALNIAADLLRQGVLVERSGKLAFAHDKIAQAAYEEVEQGELRGLHLRAGQALEASGDAAGLARHFELAEHWEKALQHYASSAAQAVRVHAYDSAHGFLSKAIGLAQRSEVSAEQQLELLEKRVEVNAVLANYQETLADLQFMQTLCNSDPQWQLKIWGYQARILSFVGQAEEGEKLAEHAYQFAATLGNTTLLAPAVLALGHILYLRAKNELAQAYLQQAVELSAQIGDIKLLATSRKYMGTVLRRLGQYDLAREHLYGALKVFEDQDDFDQQISVLTPLGISYNDQRQFEQAEACYERSLRLARQIGSRSSEARELSNLAVLYGSSGKLKKGLEAVEQSIEIHKVLGDPMGEAIVTNIYSNLLQEKLGDYQRATLHVDHSYKLAEQTKSAYVMGDALEIKGDIALAQGNLAEANRCYTEALTKAGNRMSVIHSTFGLGKTSLGTEEGLKLVEQAEQQASELEMREYQLKAMAVRAKVWFEQGKLDEALQLANAAAQILRDSKIWDHTVHYVRYLVLNAQGQHSEARASLEQARADMLAQLQDVTPEQLKMSLENVPEHRLIVQAWEAQNVQRRTTKLPKAEAPTGRPLRDDEYVEVAWTLSTPDDNKIADKTERRQHQIKRLVDEAHQQGAAPTLDDLVEVLGSSKATLKRDLAALRALGVELKTRGSRG